MCPAHNARILFRQIQERNLEAGQLLPWLRATVESVFDFVVHADRPARRDW